MTQIYAVGDIHGRDHLLKRIHNWIAIDPYRVSNDKPTVIHLGDYIDGGPDSHLVIDRIMTRRKEFDTIALLGNHEDMMLACLETDDRDVWWNWISNGGDRTLEALGVSFRFGGYDPRALRDALGAKRIEWLKSLPLYHISPPYLFVHAGIVPSVPLAEQKRKDMLWIRSRFLDSEADHGFVVVHGHTQTEKPEVKPNRICIDTGAARPKTLTAVALKPNGDPRFLQVSEL